MLMIGVTDLLDRGDVLLVWHLNYSHAVQFSLE